MLMAHLRGLWAPFSTSSRKFKEVAKPRKANLAYLTAPEPALLLLNLSVEGEFVQFEISDSQLGRLISEGSHELWARRRWPEVTRR